MLNLAAAQLRRLQHLLDAAKDEYNTLNFIILEGPTQVTFHSLKRSVTVPIGGDDVGHLNGILAEAVLNRINSLEEQIVEAHHQVVVEADEQQTEEQALTTYRDQERVGKVGTSAGATLAAHATSPNQDADST
jgi:hypothetical protein